MKAWLANLILGPLGIPVRAIIAAVVGALVSILYKDFWDAIYSVHFGKAFTDLALTFMPASVLQQLTPQSIGLAAAGAAWAGVEALVRQHLQTGVVAMQRAINASAVPVTVTVDGIASPTGETVQALHKISEIAGVEVRRATAVDPNVQAQVDHAHPIT